MDKVEPPNQSPTQQIHKAVPRWLRMSLRIALLMGLVSLPPLAIKELPSTSRLRDSANLFVVLGCVALGVWEPMLGNIVVIFTVLVPFGCVGLWLAYGLFQGCPHIIFMMAACGVVTFAVFFTAELLSLPVPLFSILVLFFNAAANVFVQSPPSSLPVAALLSVVLVLSGVIAVVVCWLVFPEFCVDEVFQHHHEGLEHLMHLAHHALGIRPPATIRRRAGEITTPGLEFLKGKKLQAFIAAASEAPELYSAAGSDGRPLSSPGSSASLSADSGTAAASSAVARTLLDQEAAQDLQNWQKAERSWYRMYWAYQAADKAVLGSKAEVVIMAAGHKRIVFPCSPFIPLAKGQMDLEALEAMRHISLSTALTVFQLFSTIHPLDPATRSILTQLRVSEQWQDMCNHLLACLQELVHTFPVDYYPQATAADRQHLREFQQGIQVLTAAWQADRLKQAVESAEASAPPVDSQSHDKEQDRELCAAAGPFAEPPAQAAAGDAVLVPAALSVEPAVAEGVDSLAMAVLMNPIILADSAIAPHLGRLQVLLILKVLRHLEQQLEQLYDATDAAAASIIRCRCCG